VTRNEPKRRIGARPQLRMPAKKAKPKKGGADDAEGATQDHFVVNYQKACKALNVTADPELIRDVRDEERETPYIHVVLGDRDIGPAGVRTIVEALLCRPVGGQRMVGGGPYDKITAIRLWRCNASDDGAVAVADLLTARKPDSEDFSMRVVCVDLLGNNIGPRGCDALGRALAANVPTLLTLSLAYNPHIADEGTVLLCEGLRDNRVLKNLDLKFCAVGEDGAGALATVFATPTSAICNVDLRGNRIGSRGFAKLCMGLRRNTVLTKLDLQDTCIGGYPPTDEDLSCIKSGVDSLLCNNTLAHLDLLNNGMGMRAVPFLEPLVAPERKSLTFFAVDASLPTEVLDKLTRLGGGGGGKKKKKGGKKKKK